jgi:hypothetical protein
MKAATAQTATVTTQAIRDSGTAGYSRERPMSPAPNLTPKLALGYLRELSADIRAGVVLAPDGALLAGPEALADPARDLLAAAPDARELQVATPDGAVFAARSDRHAVVVVCGRFALPSLVRYDLRVVLGDLAGDRREAA